MKYRIYKSRMSQVWYVAVGPFNGMMGGFSTWEAALSATLHSLAANRAARRYWEGQLPR